MNFFSTETVLFLIKEMKSEDLMEMLATLDAEDRPATIFFTPLKQIQVNIERLKILGFKRENLMKFPAALGFTTRGLTQHIRKFMAHPFLVKNVDDPLAPRAFVNAQRFLRILQNADELGTKISSLSKLLTMSQVPSGLGRSAPGAPGTSGQGAAAVMHPHWLSQSVFADLIEAARFSSAEQLFKQIYGLNKLCQNLVETSDPDPIRVAKYLQFNKVELYQIQRCAPILLFPEKQVKSIFEQDDRFRAILKRSPEHCRLLHFALYCLMNPLVPETTIEALTELKEHVIIEQEQKLAQPEEDEDMPLLPADIMEQETGGIDEDVP